MDGHARKSPVFTYYSIGKLFTTAYGKCKTVIIDHKKSENPGINTLQPKNF